VNANDYADNYTYNISEIGYDWKFFDGTQYLIVDSLCYFVKGINGDIYKVLFKTFDGSATGTTTFEETFLISSVSPLQQELESAAVYPNPVDEELNLVFSAKKALNNLDLDIYDINGAEVFHRVVDANEGLNQEHFSLPQLAPGMYHVRINSGNDAIQLKMMIAH
jgi:hypothetical protein